MTEERITPIHPGEHLAEYLEDFGITQYRLARDIQVPPRRINEIIHGKRGISADTALRLARYFVTSATYWMHLQDQYELEVAEAASGESIRNAIRCMADEVDR